MGSASACCTRLAAVLIGVAYLCAGAFVLKAYINDRSQYLDELQTAEMGAGIAKELPIMGKPFAKVETELQKEELKVYGIGAAIALVPLFSALLLIGALLEKPSLLTPFIMLLCVALPCITIFTIMTMYGEGFSDKAQIGLGGALFVLSSLFMVNDYQKALRNRSIGYNNFVNPMYNIKQVA